jgi:OOP family OmpA-OmpF porin
MKRALMIITAVTALAASPVMAGSFYVGAGIGNTFYSSEFEDAVNQIQEIDENSTGWKIFGGFKGEGFLGLEGGYRHFGEVKSSIGNETFKASIKGWDVEALGRIQIAIVDIFGKAGLMFWKNDLSFGEAEDDASGTDFLWGLGAGVHLGAIGVRVEWESIEIGSPDNLSMVSLSATLGF